MNVPPFSLKNQLSELGAELEDVVLDVLRSGQFIGGSVVDSFEKSFGEYTGINNVVGCNSGTDALVLSLRALNIGHGDEVITSSFSFFATAEAISLVGAKPVFIDTEQDSFLLDTNKIEKVITERSKAIIPVHLFGQPVNMEKILEISKKFNLKVIEDCAQALGSTWKEKSVGSWGDIGCFSFFPTKNLGAAGDAGAVATNDIELAKRLRELAIHGMPSRYFHTRIGYNSRLDSIQAAVLKVKLSKLTNWIKKRNLIAEKYKNSLKNINGLILPDSLGDSKSIHSWNQFVIKIDSNHSLPINEINNNDLDNTSNILNKENHRDIFKKNLENLGVKTIIYYPIPIHLQPAYIHLGYKKGCLPKTEDLCEKVLSLPIFPELSDKQQDHVINSVKSLFLKLNVKEFASSMPGGN